jgi:hypothetical protein
VPPNVKLPLDVTVPVSVIPLTVPVLPTLVTVPAVGVAHVGTPTPALVKTCPRVPAAVKLYEVPSPYGTAPAVGAAVLLVPPLAIGTVPEIACAASQAVAPVALNDPSASVVWLTVIVMQGT